MEDREDEVEAAGGRENGRDEAGVTVEREAQEIRAEVTDALQVYFERIAEAARDREDVDELVGRLNTAIGQGMQRSAGEARSFPDPEAVEAASKMVQAALEGAALVVKGVTRGLISAGELKAITFSLHGPRSK